ncbi:MAG TPA: thiaminase II [Candidatus Binataceae bacterium]|nr:thiaminase II [Candidatus Binataceae bacterium]
MDFTTELWNSIEPIYSDILHHPFIRGLGDGSLDRECFKFYVLQDALYLREFGRALAVTAARAPQDDWIVMFAEHAANAVKVERALHEGFFEQWGLTPTQVSATPPAPSNLAYTSYLLAVAYGGKFHEALAALLPCYWIYWEVGKTLERIGSPEPLFQRWIGTYASADFGAVVQGVLRATDETAAGLMQSELATMRQHFITTSRYEWMFWDMAYRRESWPV